jgi:beta-lactamase class A
MLKRPMSLSRRAALTACAAAVASCRRAPGPVVRTGPRLDTHRLNAEFPALADRARPGVFAIGVMSLDTTETWYWNTDRAFALASLFEVPLAAAVLALADAGRLSLAERVGFNAADLSPPFSVINQRWPSPPEGWAAQIPLSTLLTLALQWDDNTAADVLLRRIGGPGALTAWLRQAEINDFRIDRYQRELQMDIAGLPSFRPAWKDPASFFAARDQVAAREREAAMDAYLADPRDAATIPAVLEFLYKLADGKLMSAASTQRLLSWMETARPGGNLFRSGFAPSVRVAHKAGATPTDLGFSPATNDIAVVTFADGRRYVMAGCLAGSTGAQAQRATLFHDAARLITAAAI